MQREIINRLKPQEQLNLVAVMKEFIIFERQIVDLKNLMLITQDISWEAISKLIGTKLNFQEFLGLLKKFKHDCNVEVAKRLFSCYDKEEKGFLDESDLKLMILPNSLITQNINDTGEIKIEVLSKLFQVILEVQLKQLKCLRNYKFNAELAFRFLSQGRLTVNQNHVKMFLKTNGIQCTNNELMLLHPFDLSLQQFIIKYECKI
ncbi:unnamed protein product (macronuclear) [Paramecium tetraurelia]|uniref:EF-hand domain-containing protein n=1 Tax=Paramecium tetraurelia TaxID=5888 RepID=A0BK10_PARTE|nr:uncharacterized protein GSPATT00029507001 [Paramecium tetraurelia]CAK58877.1 unnamed protein product [Paramecium tetraurelia]|eukprot:XP_001426275.1 hypothetical protein (macronuclear) [Paramecium tetraurelia strain d4-2]